MRQQNGRIHDLKTKLDKPREGDAVKQISPTSSRLRTLLVAAAMTLGVLINPGYADSNLSVDQLRESFQESLKTSAFRPKFDFKAFDFLEALVEQRQNEKWLNMFRLLDEQLDGVRNQMIPADKGMWMTVGEWCDQLLRELPPEGLDKVRLYVDSRAKQSLADIESVNDIEELYRRYDRFSVSSYGHEFADQLGDALFESGNYHDAAIIWNRALMHDATDVSELRIMAKRAIALSRMNAPTRLDELCKELTDRFEGQMLSLGGVEQQVVDFVSTLNRGHRYDESGDQVERFQPNDANTWSWSVYWPELEESAKKSLPISYAANEDFAVVHLGYAAAGFDRRTAKLTWIHEHGKPHEPPSQRISQRNRLLVLRGFQRTYNPIIIPANTRTVPAVTKDRFILRMNQTETTPQNVSNVVWTIHAVGAHSGKLLWTTDETLAEMLIMADPVVVNRTVFVVCTPKTSNQLTLNALEAETGDLKWRMPLGSVDMMQAGTPGREVQLSSSGDRLYVFAGGEVAMSVNTRQRKINWLYQVKRDPPPQTNNRRRFIVRGGRITSYQNINTKPLSAVVDNLQVFLLDPELKELTCIDEDTREMRWKQEAILGRIVGTDELNAYVYDNDKQTLVAIDRETGKLVWENSLPTSVDALLSIGHQVFIPQGSRLQVFSQSDGKKSSINVIPEAGEVQRIVRDGDFAVSIARDYVTVFSLFNRDL